MLTNVLLRREVVAALVAGGVVGIGGIAAGAIGGSSDEPGSATVVGGGEPGVYSTATAKGPGIAADVAINRVLDGLAGTAVRSAKLTDPAQEGFTGAPGIRIGLDGPVDTHALWLGSLVEGAVADLMRTDEATTSELVSGGVVTGRALDGAAEQEPLGAGSIVGGQVFDSPDDESVRQHVAEVGRRFGLHVTSLSLLHPLDTAIEVTFVVPDDATIDWRMDELRDALDQSPHTTLEGSFIRLVSPSGDDVLVAGAAYRMGAGFLKFAPGQDERFGALHGGLASRPSAE